MYKFLPIVLLAFTFTGCSLFAKKPAEPTPTPTVAPTPTPAETVVDPADRPEVTFVPSGKRASEYLLTIENLPEDVESVDFFAIYMADRGESRSELGVLETYYIDEPEQVVFFGSCSSGVCNADKNISDIIIELEYETEKYGDVFLRYPIEI